MVKTLPSAQAATLGRVSTKKSSRKYLLAKPPKSQNSLHYRIHSAIMELFKRYDYEPMDLDALIFCTMQKFEISLHSYETMYKTVKQHIIDHFAVQQGRHLLLQDVSMRKLIVHCQMAD